MRVIRGLRHLSPSTQGCVATIGNFDGVHLGHRAIIENLAATGRALNLPVTVLVFEPQPREFFSPQSAPERLSRLKEKLLQLRELPVDTVVIVPFNGAFAALEPDEFVRRVLVGGLAVKHLLVGDDFRYGRRRAGDFAALERAGAVYGFTVARLAPFLIDGQRVSSTRVRDALKANDLALAERLLGRPYAAVGRVVGGDRRGRRMGFPTANLELHRNNAALSGVYAVTVCGAADMEWPGVANVGVRPTVDGGTRALLEVHLFDFTGDLYGKQLEVRFRHWLRAEQRFASIDELVAQIARDAEAARALLTLGSAAARWVG